MKIVRACVRSILMPPTSHIASLNRHTPKFSGAWNWPGVNRLASMAFHSQITQIRVRFVVIFGKESIFLAKRSVFAYSISHFFWKILVWRFIWYIWGPSMCILWPVRFFVTLWFRTGSINWNLVVRKISVSQKANLISCSKEGGRGSPNSSIMNQLQPPLL